MRFGTQPPVQVPITDMDVDRAVSSPPENYQPHSTKSVFRESKKTKAAKEGVSPRRLMRTRFPRRERKKRFLPPALKNDEYEVRGAAVGNPLPSLCCVWPVFRHLSKAGSVTTTFILASLYSIGPSHQLQGLVA
ncbi:hypothetical protein ACLB2K_039761 [Fragaria x ananassa]